MIEQLNQTKFVEDWTDKKEEIIEKSKNYVFTSSVKPTERDGVKVGVVTKSDDYGKFQVLDNFYFSDGNNKIITGLTYRCDESVYAIHIEKAFRNIADVSVNKKESKTTKEKLDGSLVTYIKKRIAEKEKDYPEDLIQAINFAQMMIKKKQHTPNKAINIAAKYYNVDPAKVRSGNASRVNIVRWANTKANKNYSPYYNKDK